MVAAFPSAAERPPGGGRMGDSTGAPERRRRRRKKRRGQQEWEMERLVEVRELPPEEGKKMKRTEYRGGCEAHQPSRPASVRLPACLE